MLYVNRSEKYFHFFWQIANIMENFTPLEKHSEAVMDATIAPVLMMELTPAQNSRAIQVINGYFILFKWLDYLYTSFEMVL